jgi:hypothetical protein
VAGFEKSVWMTNDYGLNICAHVVLGLPGETIDMMLDTARFIAGLPVTGIKIHLQYVVKDTPLAVLFEKGEYRCLERNEYIEMVVDFLELIPSDMVIQRLTGDPVQLELVAPMWAGDKNENLKLVRDRLERRDTWQGKRYQGSIVGK